MKSVILALPAVALALGACAPLAIGTGAVVAESVVQERSTTARFDDTAIKVELKSKLFDHSLTLFNDVGVDVTEGRVVLTGSVLNAEDKVTATRYAWDTPNVVSVEDQLTVEHDQGAVDWVKDAWISNQLRYALLTDADVRSVNYNVETIDRTVHLTGIARSRDELTRVIAHARRTSGVSRVVSHVLTIDDPRRVGTAS